MTALQPTERIALALCCLMATHPCLDQNRSLAAPISLYRNDACITSRIARISSRAHPRDGKPFQRGLNEIIESLQSAFSGAAFRLSISERSSYAWVRRRDSAGIGVAGALEPRLHH